MRRLVSDTLVIAERNLIRLPRNPSVIIGFRFHTSALNAIAGVGLMLLFGFAFSWFFALVGLLTSTPEAANSVAFITVFPLTFISSAFVPVDSMPEVLKAVAEVNPFTIEVNALRHLWLGAPADNNVGRSGVVVVILAIFSPLAVARYRRAAST